MGAKETAMNAEHTSKMAPNGSAFSLLMVADQSAVADGYREAAEKFFEVRTLAHAEQAARVAEDERADAVLLDAALEEPASLELIKQIKQRRPAAEVVWISAEPSVNAAVEAMRLGAFHVMGKPFTLDELRSIVERLAEHVRSTRQSRLLEQSLRTRHGFGSIVGNAPEMEKLYRIIAKAANSSHPVLILGESGTGKEMVARSIHYSGPHHDKPFIPVDCGSLVPTLIEAELFGYVKGAFTGAARSKDGLLAIADGGTVFLDEIGELPLDLQAKLLRALQEKEIRPVGATHTVRINVRILAATNRNLELAVEQGSFRKDLFYRLNVLALRVPALRDRKQDIPALSQHFLARLSRATGRHYTISPDAMQMLISYDWPGNVRELENCLERASAMSSGPALHTADLPSAVLNARQAFSPAAEAGQGPSRGIVPIAELEKNAILAALEHLNGDKLLAARMLGIGKTTLYRKLKEYGVRE
jgi:DNA-binding NtrC family response regulator